jgi:hypothetical protein
MAVNGTKLAAAIDASTLDISVASATGASAGRICKIEDEYSVVVKVSGTIISLRSRGDHGTVSRPHNIGAPVAFADATDFETIPGARHRGQYEQKDDVIFYGAAGAIAIPDKDATIVLDGATVLAMTLADPSRLQEGRKLSIVANGAAAHTITAAAGFNAGGASVDVGTFAAAVGNGLDIVAVNGKWVVVGNRGVTLA